jgi:hypothetical protein
MIHPVEAYRSATPEQRRWLCALAGIFGAYLPVTFVAPEGTYPPFGLYLLAALGVGAAVLAVSVAIVTGKPRPAPAVPRRSTWLSTVMYAAPPFAVFCAYLLLYFPAMANVDSYDQWDQIVRYRFDAFFPVAHTLIYWLPTLVWRSPAAPMLLQMTLLALSFGFSMAVVERNGAPRWLPWALTALFALHPVNGYFSVTFLKDILYSAAILWLTVVMFLVVQSEGNSLTSRGTLVHLVLALSAVALLRPNGVAPAFGGATLLLVRYRKRWRPLLASFGAFLAIYFGTSVGLARATHLSYVHHGFYEASPFIFDLGAVLHSDLVPRPKNPGKQRGGRNDKRVVAENGKVTPEERAVLQQFDDVNEWARLYKAHVIPYWHTKKDHWNLLDRPEKKAELLHAWFSIARRNPGEIIQHKIAASRVGWRIDSSVNMETFAPEADGFRMHVPEFAPSATRAANRFLEWMQSTETRWMWCHPGIWTYGSLFLFAVFAIKRSSATALLIASPLVLNWLATMAFCMAQNTRYFYASLLVLPFAASLPWTTAASPRGLG